MREIFVTLFILYLIIEVFVIVQLRLKKKRRRPKQSASHLWFSLY